MKIKKHWNQFKAEVYPNGFSNAEHEHQIERAFHGGVLIGLLLSVNEVRVLRSELNEWQKDEQARR